MARYSVSFTKAAVATNLFVVQLRTGTGRTARVVEVGIFNTTAVLSELGIARASAVGATFTSNTPQAHDPVSGAATTLLDTAATTAPTNTGNYFRQVSLPATAGAGVVWSFPGDGITVPVSAGLLLWNLGAATSAALRGYVTFDE